MEKKLTQLLFEVVDELNEQLPKDKRLEQSLNTVLFGETGTLDSLGLQSVH